MNYLKFKSRYNKEPEIPILGYETEAFSGYEDIVTKLKDEINLENMTVVIECYPGVRAEEIKENLIDPLHPEHVLYSDELALSEKEITSIMQPNLTDDRVFGILSHFDLLEFFDEKKIKKAQEKLASIKGLKIIYGVGASLITQSDLLIYCDIARWEIQKRYRSHEIGNWRCHNYDEDVLRKYKRGYFIEWRMADRIKKTLFDKIDYLLDTNLKNQPKMITGKAFRHALKMVARRPFRLVPYFDPGVWGGQWMKEACNLPKDKDNYAWSFDGVPEENSIYLRFGDIRIEVPSINVVFYQPKALLGEKVHARFGTEFPIRFDLLDTIGGQNLSLQVHPVTEYIQEKFGMHYTQDESYYILDALDDACVYLGVKNDVNKEDLIKELNEAQTGEHPFPTTKFINQFPAKKHDHFLIPAGTIHCSGKDTMVLEISATPYIFTFKLWDWGRLGLDGLPRPVHIQHGEKVIDFTRDTNWVKRNLINRVEVIEKNDHLIEERTGLHEREFIETRRFWFDKLTKFETGFGVNVLNLIEGEAAIVESPSDAFPPLEIHYAETFIIPASVKDYTIRPLKENDSIGVIKAYVRT